MKDERYTVEKFDLVSDHLSTRFFIHDHEDDKDYDVRHMVSEGFEVQYDSWADKICKRLNEQEDLIQELYMFRLMYNALLFNNWFENNTYEVYKSQRHSDGEPCFDGDWFVVVAILPSGQITNHYHMDYWDYFKIPEYAYVKHEFDNHTSEDVLKRLSKTL